MALQKTTQTPHGFEASNAYHRVEAVALTSKTLLAFQVRSYKSSQSTIAFADASYTCAYDIDGENPIKQAYVYLKSTEVFSDAEDV